MQDHTQHPMLFLVPVEGEGKTVEDLEVECRADLLATAQHHLRALSGSTSRWLPFLNVIAEECAPAATGASVRAV